MSGLLSVDDRRQEARPKGEGQMSRTRHISRRLVAIVAAAGLFGVGLGTAASADTAPTDPTDPASPPTVAADALPAPQIDGVVWSQTVVGDTVYVGGQLHDGAPGRVRAGTWTRSRARTCSRSASAPGSCCRGRPVADGQVRSITRSPDGSRIYVTGDFSKIDGVYHVRIAAFNTATNTIVAGFKPTLASIRPRGRGLEHDGLRRRQLQVRREHHRRHAGPAHVPRGVRRRDRCDDAVRRRRQRRGDRAGGHDRTGSGSSSAAGSRA